MIGSGTYGPREIAVASFSHQLVVATMNLELHPPGSPHVQTNLDDLLTSLRDGETAGVPMPLTLVVFDDRLYHAGRPLAAQSLHASRLLRLCNERRITSLGFQSGLDAAELLRFLVLLDTPQKVGSP